MFENVLAWQQERVVNDGYSPVDEQWIVNKIVQIPLVIVLFFSLAVVTRRVELLFKKTRRFILQIHTLPLVIYNWHCGLLLLLKRRIIIADWQ
jgi:hypothetical protein